MKKKILVIGGTGMLGKPVAMKFKEAGYDTTVFTRNVSEARIKMPGSFNFAEGNTSNPETLEKAMENCDGVHINLQGGTKLSDIEETEYRGVVHAVDAAKKTGVRKISLITGSSVNEANTWYKPNLFKFRSEEYLKNSGIDYSIFRPSWFFESLPLFIRNNKAMLIGNNANRYSWVAASDYAGLVVKSFGTAEAANCIFYVLGPEKLTMEEALERYIKLKHPGMRISKTPAAVFKLIAMLSFSQEMKYFANFFEYFSKTAETLDAKLTEDILGQPSTRLEEWVVSQIV